MIEHPKFDPDFTLPDELVSVRRLLADDLSLRCAAFVEEALEAGMDEAQATTAVVDLMIQCAAGTACRVRRHLLGGEPNEERWQAVTGNAFNRAVEYTKPTSVNRDSE